MELRQRKRINNTLPKFDSGRPSWLFSNPGLSYELPQQLDDFGFEIDNSPQSQFFDNDINTAHFNITGRNKPYLYDDYPNIMNSMYNTLSPYFKKMPESIQPPQVQQQNVQQPITNNNQIIYSTTPRMMQGVDPDSIPTQPTVQRGVYQPQPIESLQLQPVQNVITVNNKNLYHRPAGSQPSTIPAQPQPNSVTSPAPNMEITLPETQVIGQKPIWQAAGYASKMAYDLDVAKYGNTKLGKEQHKALTGAKVASVVGGVTSLAQGYLGQQSAVKSTEELMANAGTQNRSIGGVGYVRQNYANDSEVLSNLDKSGLSSTIGGVASGASAGAAFGPWGAAIGGVVGGITGLLGWSTSKSAQRKRLNNARQLTSRINTGNQAGAMTTALQQDYYSQYGNTNGGVLYANKGKDIKKIEL